MVITLISAYKLTLSCVTLFAYYSLLSSTKEKKLVYLYFFLISFAYSCLSLTFFYDFLPGAWTPSVPFQYFFVTLFLIVTALFSSLAILIVPYGFFFAQKKHLSFLYYPFLFGLLFFLSDIIRSLLLSFFYLGKESGIGLRLFLGSLGEALTFTPLSLFAYKGGVYFLTLVLGIIVYLLFAFVQKKLSVKIFFLSFTFLTLWYSVILVIPRPQLPKISVDIVTTDFDNKRGVKDKETYIKRYELMYKLVSSSKTKRDLLIFPESTYFLSLHDILKKENSRLPYSYIIDSGDVTKKVGRFSYSFFYDTQNDVTEVRGKDDLMIFNEYSSYFADMLLFLFTTKETRTAYHELIDTKRSQIYNTFSLPNTPYTFATLLCSEATSYMPLFFFEKVNPSFYVLQSNLSIMNGKPLALSEYYNYSKLLALTTGKPVIAVSNQAPSFIYDGYGNVIKKIEQGNALQRAF